MSAPSKRRGLGRGLSSLLGDDAGAAPDTASADGAKRIPIELLHPGKFQPRHQMDEAALKELAQSVAEKGILQPLLVRQHPDKQDAYEIIAGERRWRAAQAAKIHDVPVIIKKFTDQEVLEVALIENLQRQDLTPLDEAAGYQRLMEEFRHTQDDLAKVVGKSRSHVANMMRLLSLPEPVKKMLNTGELSVGHARALLNAKDTIKLARRVVKRGLNVRQTEKLAQQETVRGKTHKAPITKDADTVSLEKDLTNILGLKTEIHFKGEGGSVTIHYLTLEQLDDILQRLSQAGPPTQYAASLEPDPTDAVTAIESEHSSENAGSFLNPGDTAGDENNAASQNTPPHGIPKNAT